MDANTPYSNLFMPDEGKGYQNMGQMIADLRTWCIAYDTYMHTTFVSSYCTGNVVISGMDGGTF